MKQKGVEVNFDGLVGPTHHYAGLSFGNVASTSNAHHPSNPKKAALQGLEKMALLMRLGVPQAVFPPQERPCVEFLRDIGFVGKNIEILEQAQRSTPAIFSSVYSSSSMWAANMATVSPSVDTQDGRVHITPANLVTCLHRSIEAEFNKKVLNVVFSNKKYFRVHDPLFPHLSLADEGAANHNRICFEYGEGGTQLFFYGTSDVKNENKTQKYPARQTLEASEAIVRLHQLDLNQILFVKQNPDAIDKGVFHNDVISTANQNFFLYHEDAFEDLDGVVNFLRKKVDYPLHFISVSRSELSVKDSVDSYLFNSQIVTLPNGKMSIIAPIESQENKQAHKVLLKLVKSKNPIHSLHFVDCRESMRNGGGPACLRLRMVLKKNEIKACHANIFLDEILLEQLFDWVNKHYRDRLVEKDLLDPNLLQESHRALDELTEILELGSIYSFQKV